MNKMDNSNEENDITLTELLRQGWLAPKILAYLDGKDAIRFASASRDTRVVRLKRLNLPHTSFWGQGPWNGPSQAEKWQDLPPLHSAHTVYLSGVWHGQNWGNRNGMLSVVANGGRAPDDFKPCSEKVLCHAHPAPHWQMVVYLSFRPDAEDKSNHPYSIWIRGGHELDLWNLHVRVLSYTTNGE